MQITQTISKAEDLTPTSTILKLKEKHAEISTTSKVAEIVKELQNFKIFGEEVQQKINTWAKDSLPLFSKDDKEPSLEALIALTAEIVRPTFLMETPEDTQIALLEIDDKIRDLMEKYLPMGKTSEALIADYKPKNFKVMNVPVKEEIFKTLGEKLSELVKNIEESTYFSDDEKMYVLVWKETLPKEFFDLNGEQSASELASIALADLLTNVHYPALLRAKEEKEKKTLHQMTSQLKEILIATLPKGISLEKFLSKYQELSMKTAMYLQKDEIVKQCSIETRKQLCKDANAVQSVICQNSEKSKEEFLDLNNSRRLIGNQANGKILALTSKIGPLIENMKENETKMTSLADTLEKCHQKFQENTRNCQEMLNKI